MNNQKRYIHCFVLKGFRKSIFLKFFTKARVADEMFFFLGYVLKRFLCIYGVLTNFTLMRLEQLEFFQIKDLRY